jgi:hypothetical protein
MKHDSAGYSRGKVAIATRAVDHQSTGHDEDAYSDLQDLEPL